MKGRMALIRFLLAGLIAWNLFSAIPSIAQFSVPSASTNLSVSGTGAYKALPSGSTWTDVVAAYKSAASGDTIGLPNGPMIQSTSIWWTKNVDHSPTSNVVFANFTIEQKRSSGMRNNPLSTGDFTTNITIRNMTFIGCTANCIQILSNNAGPARNINIMQHVYRVL